MISTLISHSLTFVAVAVSGPELPWMRCDPELLIDRSSDNDTVCFDGREFKNYAMAMAYPHLYEESNFITSAELFYTLNHLSELYKRSYRHSLQQGRPP